MAHNPKKRRAETQPERGMLDLFKQAASTLCKIGAVVLAASLVASPVAGALLDHQDTPDSPDKQKSNDKAVTVLSNVPENNLDEVHILTERLAGNSTVNTTLDIAGGGTGGCAVQCGIANGLDMAKWMLDHGKEYGNDFGKILKGLDKAQKNGTIETRTHIIADETYASSIGYLTLLYTLSGNAFQASEIVEGLDSSFLSEKRTLTNLVLGLAGLTDENTKPGMDLDVIKDILQGKQGAEKALNMEKVLAGINNNEGKEYYVVATNLDTLEPVIIPLRGLTDEQLLDLVDIVCGVCGVAGEPKNWTVNGEKIRLVDAKSCGMVNVNGLGEKGNAQIHFGNGGTESVPNKDILKKVTNLITVLCSAPYANSPEHLAKIIATEQINSEQNFKELQAAQQNGSLLYLGLQGDQGVSSSEMDDETLKDYRLDSCGRTAFIALKDIIDKGTIDVKPNHTYTVNLSDEDGKKLVIHTDGQKKVDFGAIVPHDYDADKLVKKAIKQSPQKSVDKDTKKRLDPSIDPKTRKPEERRRLEHYRQLDKTQNIRPDLNQAYMRNVLKNSSFAHRPR